MANIAPLNSAFLVTSIIGFLISVFYLPQYSQTWAFTFGFIFITMFVASMISMVRGPVKQQL